MRFKEALAKMAEEGEFERIIKASRGKERESAKEFYSLIKGNKDLADIPDFPLLMAIHSKNVLREIIVYMGTDGANMA